MTGLIALLAIACNGQTDATDVLQRLLDAPGQEIAIPATAARCLTGTLTLRGSGRTLRVDPDAVLQLRDGTTLLRIEASNSRVRGGQWIGAGPSAAGASWESGLIEVRADGVTVEESRVADAPASGVLVLDAAGADLSRLTVESPRGVGIALHRAPWSVVKDSTVRGGHFDGVGIGPGSDNAAVLRVHVDHRGAAGQAGIPWSQYCGYAGGIGAYGARSAFITWNVIDGPLTPRPDCHLYIPISLAAGSDDSVARQNIVNGGAGGANYCLEIAAASRAVLDTNWISGCRVGISVSAGEAESGERGPVVGATLRDNAIRDAEIGLLVTGPVRGLRVDGQHMERVGREEVRNP